jgi:hypothetical protein
MPRHSDVNNSSPVPPGGATPSRPVDGTGSSLGFQEKGAGGLSFAAESKNPAPFLCGIRRHCLPAYGVRAGIPDNIISDIKTADRRE